jgi:hypothetical protein
MKKCFDTPPLVINAFMKCHDDVEILKLNLDIDFLYWLFKFSKNLDCCENLDRSLSMPTKL